jgi:uncharacterized protein YndB with AHSA1/START domain
METRKHEHFIELPVPAEEVFKLLHTPSDIRAWWFASRAIVDPRENGIWAAAWGDDEDAPDYITSAVISIFDPPNRMMLTDYRYFARSGPPPFKADFTTEFIVVPKERGSILRVVQDGFPAAAIADEFYAACEKGWSDTFASIQRYLNERQCSINKVF